MLMNFAKLELDSCISRGSVPHLRPRAQAIPRARRWAHYAAQHARRVSPLRRLLQRGVRTFPGRSRRQRDARLTAQNRAHGRSEADAWRRAG